MNITNVTLKMDKALKEQLESLLSDLGLDMSTYFTHAAKQTVREHAIPIEVTTDVLNAETIKAMKDVIEGKDLSREYSSFSKMMQDLDVKD